MTDSGRPSEPERPEQPPAAGTDEPPNIGLAHLPAAPAPAQDPSAGSVVDQFVERANAWALKPVDMLGKIAIVLVVINTVSDVVYAWTSWNTYNVFEESGLAGYTVELQAADELSVTVGWVFIATGALAAVAFILWLWRARANAETLRPVQHTRSKGWVIGSWIVPIVSLWFPYQVVRDIWATSNPAIDDPSGVHSVGKRKFVASSQLRWWWAGYLISTLAAGVSWELYDRDPGETMDSILEWLAGMALADTLSAAAWVLAAVLVIKIIRQINGWQTPLVEISPGQPGRQEHQPPPAAVG